MVLCSAKNCSSFSFSLILFISFFILVCSILFQFCFLAAMTAMDFDKQGGYFCESSNTKAKF